MYLFLCARPCNPAKRTTAFSVAPAVAIINKNQPFTLNLFWVLATILSNFSNKTLYVAKQKTLAEQSNFV